MGCKEKSEAIIKKSAASHRRPARGRSLLKILFWAGLKELLDYLNDVVRSVLFISGPTALAHPRVHYLMLEVGRNRVVPHDAPHQSHHDCGVGISISTFEQSLEQTIHKLDFTFVDFDAGIGERGLEFSYVSPALDLYLKFDMSPKVLKLITASRVDPFRSLVKGQLMVPALEDGSKHQSIN